MDNANPAAEPNPELAATGACVAALEDLDTEQQEQVVTYLGARFGNFVPPMMMRTGRTR